MVMLARRLARSETGSISAPARKVKTPRPSIARKFVQSVVCKICWPPAKWMLPAATPTTISISATEMPTRIEIRLARNASPIQMAATNQIFSCIKNSCERLFVGVISAEFVRRFSHAGRQTPLPCKWYGSGAIRQQKIRDCRNSMRMSPWQLDKNVPLGRDTVATRPRHGDINHELERTGTNDGDGGRHGSETDTGAGVDTDEGKLPPEQAPLETVSGRWGCG